MKETHYERIIGGSEEERQKALQSLQEMFESKPESFAPYELKKTPEDKEIIDRVTAIVDEMVKSHGGDPKPLPQEKIHILKPGSILIITEGKLAGGVHKPLSLNIGVEKGESRFMFASSVAHELFHLKSYKAARVSNSGEDVRLYRSGISMVDRKDADAEAGEEKEYFGILEEGIVAECTRKAMDRIGKETLFNEETKAIAKLRDWAISYFRSTGIPEEKLKLLRDELKYIPDPITHVEQILSSSDDEDKRSAYAAGIFHRLVEEKQVESLERYEERKKLYDLLDNLIKKSEGKFKDREEVFEEFAQANFSGNYLKIARIIEDILGKGSFKKLANEFAIEIKTNKKI